MMLRGSSCKLTTISNGLRSANIAMARLPAKSFKALRHSGSWGIIQMHPLRR